MKAPLSTETKVLLKRPINSISILKAITGEMGTHEVIINNEKYKIEVK